MRMNPSTRMRQKLISKWVDVLEYQCTWCGEWFEPRRSDAAHCSERCRMARYRQRKRLGLVSSG